MMKILFRSMLLSPDLSANLLSEISSASPPHKA